MANSTGSKSVAKSRATRSKNVQAIPELSPGENKPPRSKRAPFPLWLHKATGQWGKKIRGHKRYFGTNKDEALERYMWDKPYREAGREPPPFRSDQSKLTIKKLGDTFLTHKRHQVQIGELTQTSFNDYQETCQRLADNLGKTTVVESLQPEDLLKYRHTLAKSWGPNTLGNEINRCRVVLRFAFENGLIDRPIRFGEFKRPKKVAIRRRRSEVGPRVFDPADLRALIDSADVHLRVMIYLGINCGMGNADCGTLPLAALDLDQGWIDFPRRKTGIVRHCPLWPETIHALQHSIAKRKEPLDKNHSELVFITKYGDAWYTDGQTGSPVSAEFRKLLDAINRYSCKCGAKPIAVTIEGSKCAACGRKLKCDEKGIRRPGLSFYSLRHNFQTIADELGDYVATRRIMGHADPSISDNYRERFPDERLRRVVDHVQSWLYPRPSVLP